jgi:hypothetical protein
MGQDVKPVRQGQYTFVVSIMQITADPNPQQDHICMGTLVTKRDVLTNEHCMRSENLNEIQLIIGSNSLLHGTKYYPLWWKTYDEWCLEKNIPIQFDINDVAIIRVSNF